MQPPQQPHIVFQHYGMTADTPLPLRAAVLHAVGHVGRIITPEEFQGGAVVLPEPWLVRYVIEHPDEIRNLTRRQFQEFSAALLERKGMRVKLGPVGPDGGVDVRAERDGEFGPELILVQTKHPDPGNKVTLDTVKLLHLQVVLEHATRGLVMTDSTFTRNALQQIAAYRFPDGRRRRRADPAVAPRAQNGYLRGRYADSALIRYWALH